MRTKLLTHLSTKFSHIPCLIFLYQCFRQVQIGVIYDVPQFAKIQWQIQRGLGETKLFLFHGDFSEILGKINK